MIGLFVVALLALLLLGGLVYAVVWAVKGAGAIRLGHAMLTCPHCAAETQANLEVCQQCGSELR